MAFTINGTTGIDLGTQPLTGSLPDANAPVGSVLQVVSAILTGTVTSSSNTFVDTGMSATITPISTSSKILVLVNHGGVSKNVGNANNSLKLRLLRGATVIFSPVNLFGFTSSNSYNVGFTVNTTFLDSPNTTSAVTYKTQYCNYENAGTVEINANGDASTITLMEIVA
jgi:hypothetical protein